MVDIVISVVAKVAEYLVAPVGRQLGYLFCYNSNLAELQNQVEKLDDKRRRLHRSVNEAERQGNGIEDDVQKWLKRADGISQEVEKFIEDEKNAKKRCCKGLCPNLVSRYKLSRKAKKKALDVKKSQEGGNFETISYPLPPPGAGSVALPGGYEDFESRNPALEQIMESLRSDDVTMIGVWGMGGVGKTTLVKQVAKLAQDEKLFDQVVTAYVSQTVDLKKIQEEIKDALGLKFEEASESVRAKWLSESLKTEKVLIIFDDLWAGLDLAAVGIPSDHGGCKIVLTSRRLRILSNEMGTQKNFPVEHLSEEEAWGFFKKTAGDAIEKSDLKPTAEEVLRKCGGLPLAIVTVAKALKNKDLITWKDALRQLSRSIETTVEGIEARIFVSLEFSYDNLYGDEVKSLFLLCGLLDYGDTLINDLFKYGVGLHLFQNVGTLEEARDRLHTLIDTLKASSLLLESRNYNYVRMHDVVREVARAIASKDPHRYVVRANDDQFEEWSNTDESKSCTGISLNCRARPELPQVLVCPELKFFLLQGNDLSLEIPNTCFERMEKLQVLALSDLRFTFLPSSFASLSNIQTLCLDGCELGDIALIGKLTKLQVLSMVGSNIQQLPQEMAQLTNLRLLDLNYCRELKVIPRNILSNLSRLECLFMKSSFSQWTAEEVSDGESNACLSELNHLDPHLMTIVIEIPSVELIPKEDKFVQNLTSFTIFIGNFHPREKRYDRLNTLSLKGGDGSLLMGNRMRKLLEKNEKLELRELKDIMCLFSPSIHVSFHNLKYLSISHCGMEDKDKENISIPTEDGVLFGEKVSFPNLGLLELEGLDKLKEIWNYQLPSGSFSKLEILNLENCPRLLLAIPSHSIQKFHNLKKINVSDCAVLAHVFDLEGIDRNTKILPRLEELRLFRLYRLRNIFCGEFKVNGDMNDDKKGKMRCLFSVSTPINFKRRIICSKDKNENMNEDKNDNMNEDKNSFKLVNFDNLKHLEIRSCGIGEGDNVVLFDEKISLPILEKLKLDDLPKLKEIWHHQLPCMSNFNLQILEVYNCRSLINLMPSHLISMFTNLKNIVVNDCEVLEHVFDIQRPDRSVPNLLPVLQTLKLKKLPRLRYILYGEGKIKDNMKCLFSPPELMDFQSLMVLYIENCAEEDKVEIHVNATVEDITLFSEKVSFSNLKELNLKNLAKLKEIWHHQVPHVYFNHLQILEVYNCPCLVNLIPSHLIQGFTNLLKIKVDNCGVLEHVFVFDPQEIDRNIGIFPKLETLELKGLRRLRCIISDKDKTNSTSCLFSPTTPKDFQNLKRLYIKGCEEDKNEGQRNTSMEEGAVLLFGEKIELRSLEELDISNLDNLQKIWHDKFTADSFGNLKRLSVESCQKLEKVIPYNMSSLQIVKIVACNSVEEVFDLEIDNSEESLALQLRELCLDNLKHLKCVWNKTPQGLVTYENLNRVKISGCPSFQTPFPGYVMRSLLQVKEVDMISYGVDQDIVEYIDVAEVVSMFLFPEPTSLTNSCLEKLECFYVGLHTLEWPILKTLEVESCESLEILASELKKTEEQPIFLCDKVAFPNLEVLNLSLKLEEITDLQVLFGALTNLKILTVENCGFLRNPFPLQFIQCLNNLEKLTVKKCGLLKEVFDLKGFDYCNVKGVEILSKIEELSLIDLPELKHICKNSPTQVSCFQNLKSLQMKKCNSLKYLFLPSMALGLVQLQHLSIEHCPEMENIVTAQDKGFKNQRVQASCFWNLKSVLVKQCHNLKSLFPSSMVLGLLQLQDLRIEHCFKMEEIILEDGDVGNGPGDVSFFQNLEIVRITHCDSLKHLFSPCMALGLGQLQDLCIEHCSKMEEVIMGDGDKSNRPKKVSPFRNLKLVRVMHCDSLKHLFSPCLALGLQQLQDLHIEHCSEMEHIIMEDGDTHTSKEIIIEDGDTSNRPQKVSSSLGNLKIVRVMHCHSLKHLFSPGMASGLVQLEDLYIEHCSKMEEIIMGDGDKSNRPQLVSSFQNLKIVQVMHCDNLKHLFSPCMALGLQQLQDLRIEHCSEMEHIIMEYGNMSNKPQQVSSLQNLKSVCVRYCDKLMYLFSSSMAFGLVQLQDTCIEHCSRMQGIVTAEAVVTGKIINFHQMTRLLLLKLPELRSFYQRTETGLLFGEEVAFPSLVSLYISGLALIKEIWNNERTANSFSTLDKVKMEDCNEVQIHGLPFFVLKCLPKLRSLRIANCGKIEVVFDLADFLDHETATSLKKLKLHDLPKLKHIWSRDPYGILTFQNLDFLEVIRCEDLEGQFPSCLTRDLSHLEKQLIRSREPKDPEHGDYVFPQVAYDKRFNLPKNKGKEVVVVRASERDYVGEISEDVPGTSG